MLKRLRLHGFAGMEYISTLPQELITGTGTDPRPRLRVESDRTSFAEGREFRILKELNLAAGLAYLLRLVVPNDIIIRGLSADIDLGNLRVETLFGGTPSGTFSELPAVIPCNGMSTRPTPFYTPQVTVSAVPTGGTLTGGTTLGILRAKSSGALNAASTVGSSESDERGWGAGTYFLRFTNLSTDAVTGVFRMRWEETLPASSRIISY